MDQFEIRTIQNRDGDYVHVQDLARFLELLAQQSGFGYRKGIRLVILKLLTAA